MDTSRTPKLMQTDRQTCQAHSYSCLFSWIYTHLRWRKASQLSYRIEQLLRGRTSWEWSPEEEGSRGRRKEGDQRCWSTQDMERTFPDATDWESRQPSGRARISASRCIHASMPGKLNNLCEIKTRWTHHVSISELGQSVNHFNVIMREHFIDKTCANLAIWFPLASTVCLTKHLDQLKIYSWSLLHMRRRHDFSLIWN